jgi:hypothetical protein
MYFRDPQRLRQGDRIRCARSDGTDLELGKIYRVILASGGHKGEDTFGIPLVHVRRQDGNIGAYFIDRFVLVERRRFTPGQEVRVVEGCKRRNLIEGDRYVVFAVTSTGMVRLCQRHLEIYMPTRFAPVEQELGEIDKPGRKKQFDNAVSNYSAAPVTIGTMAEYGPARPEPEQPNPLWGAIGRTFPTHPADVALLLNEFDP